MISPYQSLPIPGLLFAGVNIHAGRTTPGHIGQGICLLLDTLDHVYPVSGQFVCKCFETHNSYSPLGQGACDVVAVEVFPLHNITTTHHLAFVLFSAFGLSLAANCSVLASYFHSESLIDGFP